MMVSSFAGGARAGDGTDAQERVLSARIQFDAPVRFFGSFSQRTSDLSGSGEGGAAAICASADGTIDCSPPEAFLATEAATEVMEAPLTYRRGAERAEESRPGINLTVHRLITYRKDCPARVHLAHPNDYSLYWRDGSLPADFSVPPLSANPFFVVLFAPASPPLQEDQEIFSAAGAELPQPDRLSSRGRSSKTYRFLDGDQRPSWKTYAQAY